MKRIYHCADLHLGADSKFVPGLLDAQFKAIEQVSDDAVKNDVSTIVIAGDLFDSPHVLSSVIEGFRKVIEKYAGINYIAVSGTHGHDSYENERSVYKRSNFENFPGNFYLLDRSENGYVIIDDIAYYSSTHTLGAKPAAGYHVLVFHGVAEEVQNFIQGSSVKNYDYIALGHYHFFNQFSINNIPCAYSGSLLAHEWPKGKQGINESTYAEVAFEKNTISVTRRHSSSVQMVRHYVSRSEHLDDVESRLSDNTWLMLWGKPELKEEAYSRFRDRVKSIDYRELEVKDLPGMVVNAVEKVIQEQEDDSIPWDRVKEAVLALLSGEEGTDFINPDKYMKTMVEQ